ncbi:hypothetical protein QJ48_30535 [Paenibacillus sp. A3]|uniref:hypothetical protein n=1 Tax=Paenibacillus sp. A3 TaxID=1337054 RepID=UPI0006D5A3D9|nr:hypothetical protein [Paenibacillus sp. A3]KPV55925.1 hypothetical protein QJ48_30535 [Paenibacillus sp. A3]
MKKTLVALGTTATLLASVLAPTASFASTPIQQGAAFTAEKLAVPMISEPDDFTDIELPVDKLKGTLETEDSVVWYRFKTPAKLGDLKVKLKGPSGQTYKISVYDSDDDNSSPLLSINQDTLGTVKSSKLKGDTYYYFRVGSKTWKADKSHDYKIEAYYNK